MDRLASEWDAEWDSVQTSPPVLLLCPKKKSPVGSSDVTGHKAFPEPQVKAPVPCCCANQLCTFLTSGYLSSCWLWTGIYLVLLIPEIRKGRAQGLAHSGIPGSVSKHNRQTNKLSRVQRDCCNVQKKKKKKEEGTDSQNTQSLSPNYSDQRQTTQLKNNWAEDIEEQFREEWKWRTDMRRDI